MNFKLHFFLTLITIAWFSSVSFGQEFRKGPVIVCPADPNSYDTRVHLRKELAYLSDIEGGRRNFNAGSNITVNYNGFTDEAKNAFQFAVDIWANLIPSDVEIVIDANFADLGSGVLGSAGSAFFVRDFKNAPSDTTFYPIALAEKLAGEQLNLEGEPEVFCSFSSTFDFYFGTDGNTPADQFDFVTIVLHELGHGLGFAGVEDHESGIGNWDYFNNKTARYNEFVELGDGTAFLDLENNSTETGNAITGEDLFFNGVLTVATLGQRAELYAPSSYEGGSSFSHLDEATYPAGDEHSLMSPQVGRGESIFDPGVSLDIFADMGWFITVLDHDVDRRIVDNVTDDIVVQVNLRTDTTITDNNLKVVYTTDDFETTTEVNLTEGASNQYSATIPNPGEGTLRYYFDGVSDGLGRDVRSPMTPNSYYEVTIKNIGQETLSAGQNLYDFESGDQGFFPVLLEGNVNLWERGTPGNILTSSSTATNVWKTGLTTNVGDSRVAVRDALVTPYFDMTDTDANYLLKFELGMDLGENEGSPFESGPLGANVEYTLDRGLTWQVLGKKHDQAGDEWYNFQNNGGGAFSTNVFDNEAGWIMDSVNTAVPVSFNISSLAGNTHVGFRIVFHAESDFIGEGYIADGVLVDNFEIDKGDPTADFVVANPSPFHFPGSMINFEYISSGASTYLWDFGDGNTSVDDNPSHSYSSGGLYSVSLTIDDGADIVVKDDLITIISEDDANYSLADGGNFEADNGDFIVANISGTGFERGSSNVEGKDGTSSGNFAWVTGLEDEQYVDRSEAFLYTPIFDFSSLGTYSISFQSNYDTEQGWDGFIVEYSSDLGASWNQLDSTVDDSWYDEIGEDNPEQGWPAIPLFTGTTGGDFVKKERDISSLGGQGQIVFRFHWLSDFASTDVGIAIDDFELTGPIPGDAVPDFSFTNPTGCDGQEVIFTNESTGSISDIEWDFGANATPATASGIGPHTVTYSGSGSSTVTMTVTSPENGVQIEEKVNVIETSPLHEPSITQTYNGDGTYTLQASAGDSYEWVRNGEILEGETNQTLIVDIGDGGEFSVFVTVGSCAIEAESLIVNSVLESSIAIYPNPASDFLTISSGIHLSGQYSIYNISGRVIYSSRLDSKELIVDVRGIKEGIYFMRLNVNNETIVKEIIIRK